MKSPVIDSVIVLFRGLQAHEQLVHEKRVQICLFNATALGLDDKFEIDENPITFAVHYCSRVNKLSRTISDGIMNDIDYSSEK